jgi:nucleoid-associated protein YgaU
MQGKTIAYIFGAAAVSVAVASAFVIRGLASRAAPVSVATATRAAPNVVVTPSPASTTVRGVVAPPPASPTQTPTFDIVRVETSGETVVAGHAEPGSHVELRDGDRVIATIAVDETGEFVVLPPNLSEGPHRLQLVSGGAGAPLSRSEIVNIDADHIKSALAARAPGSPLGAGGPTPTIGTSDVVTAASATRAFPGVATATHPPLPVAQRAPPHESPSGITAPAVPSAAPSQDVAAVPTSRLPSSLASLTPAPSPVPRLQPVPAPTPSSPPTDPIAASVTASTTPLMVAKANPAGPEVSVSSVQAIEPSRLEAQGSADAQARVRLTLNGAFLADVVAGADRLWSLTIEKGMSAGLYTLVAEEMPKTGGPTLARAEAPFAYPQHPSAARETVAAIVPQADSKPAIAAPAANAAVAPAAMAPVSSAVSAPSGPGAAPVIPLVSADPSHAVVADVRTTVVARGDNLWDLARKFYGDGMRYSDIYLANAAAIRKPSLIYIGQIFVVPSAEARPR